MSWESVQKRVDEQPTGGQFIRLAEDGDTVVGVFCGEPFAREIIWESDASVPFDADRHKGKRPSLRIAINFFETATKEMRIFEMNATTFRDVVKCKDKYGLEKWSFEITRHGTGKKTTYSILPEDQLKPEQQVYLAEKIRLIDLATAYAE